MMSYLARLYLHVVAEQQALNVLSMSLEINKLHQIRFTHIMDTIMMRRFPDYFQILV